MIITSRVFSITLKVLPIAFLFMAGTANAKHLKLYGYGLADEGTGTLTYNFDFVNGPKGGTQTGQPMLHELELEYAFTKHWVQSLYLDYDYAAAAGGNSMVNEVTAIKTEFNINFFEQGELPVDFRINIELAKALNNKVDAYGNIGATDTAEIRFIFEKSFDRYTFILGPMGVRDIGGPGTISSEWSYAYANAVIIEINDTFAASLEFFGDLGVGSKIFIDGTQSHTVVPNVNIAVAKDTTLSLGAGIPLNNSTDDFVFRMSVAQNWEKIW